MSAAEIESAWLTVLLVDLRQLRRESGQAENKSDFHRILEREVVVHWVFWADDISEKIEDIGARVLFFEYDYPDIARLSYLQQTKLRHPSIPIILVTEQHSEALSVWALRSRVWDYFVKPLAAAEVFYCLESLKTMLARQGRETSRKAILPPRALPADARFRGASQKDAINAGIAYIEKNLHEEIPQSKVAEYCGMTPFHFSRQFKQIYGITFQEFVIRRRITEAIRLLKNPSASVTNVCYTVGFRDLSYFTRTFRRYVGMTPSRYKMDLEASQTSLPSQLKVPSNSKD